MKDKDRLLPEGTYSMLLVSAERKTSTASGRPYWQVIFVPNGTDRYEYDALSEDPRARWKLRQYGVTEPEDLPTLVGRTFLVEYGYERWTRFQKRGRIKKVLHEITDQKGESTMHPAIYWRGNPDEVFKAQPMAVPYAPRYEGNWRKWVEDEVNRTHRLGEYLLCTAESAYLYRAETPVAIVVERV